MIPARGREAQWRHLWLPRIPRDCAVQLWRFSENVSDGLGIIGGICPARSLATDGTEIATSPILA